MFYENNSDNDKYSRNQKKQEFIRQEAKTYKAEEKQYRCKYTKPAVAVSSLHKLTSKRKRLLLTLVSNSLFIIMKSVTVFSPPAVLQ